MQHSEASVCSTAEVSVCNTAEATVCSTAEASVRKHCTGKRMQHCIDGMEREIRWSHSSTHGCENHKLLKERTSAKFFSSRIEALFTNTEFESNQKKLQFSGSGKVLWPKFALREPKFSRFFTNKRLAVGI